MPLSGFALTGLPLCPLPNPGFRFAPPRALLSRASSAWMSQICRALKGPAKFIRPLRGLCSNRLLENSLLFNSESGLRALQERFASKTHVVTGTHIVSSGLISVMGGQILKPSALSADALFAPRPICEHKFLNWRRHLFENHINHGADSSQGIDHRLITILFLNAINVLFLNELGIE
jgi:hypothetical protein